MGKVLSFLDRLTNVMSGQGTTIDRRTAASYVFNIFTPQQAEAAYRTDWLVRKIVDIPPLDMTRNWRDWQAEGADIEKLEKEEKRLGLKAKCKRALVLSRLYGGGALVIGTGDSDPMQPLNVEAVKAGGLTYVHVMSPQQLSLGQPILDPESEWFGKPEYFQINDARNQRPKLHPSRVVEFIGQHAPEGAFHHHGDWLWGDPIMQSISEAVKNAGLAQDGFAALIDEAKLDIIKFPNLTELVQTAEGDQRLLNRLQATALGKSTWRTVALDKEDEWQQRQITWAGMPQIIESYLNIVAGASDIPVTRLLGQSPKGLQSTGEGEERDYHAMVKARQDELLCPALDRIDELLIRSALGSRPEEIYYEFAPLDQTSEKDKAAIEKQAAETIKLYSDVGFMPEQALAAMAKNRIVEGGYWPGSESAFEDVGEEPEEIDGGDLTTRVEKVEQLRIAGAVNEDQATLLMADARPRTLYVSRKLLNGAELVKWAKAQGFETTVPAAEMHVTVLFSKKPVDWMKMGSGWEGDDKGRLKVPPGGARLVEPLGDKGAIVLLFSSSSLAWRHEDMVRNGASHDFPDYQPHVTITYEGAADLDLDKVEPFRGELLFGPEIFTEIVEDWEKSLIEA